ncbi:MAG: sulfite oxidase-like oxidoreductase, partial [Chloroflexi bacterium]|nr:sulfite oxidase-like oxidoreductase [Chloroflexota bacterium]
MGIITRGFFGRRRQEEEDENVGRVPPGQDVDRGFPVLSAGPTPRVDTSTWTFRIDYNG